MTVRRRCACRTTIEAEADEQSVAHAVRVHREQPEHRRYVELRELEAEKVPPLRVMVRRVA